jgi:hypothetical protein
MNAVAFLTFDPVTRVLGGQVQFFNAATETTGAVSVGTFGPSAPPGPRWPAGQYDFTDARQSPLASLP